MSVPMLPENALHMDADGLSRALRCGTGRASLRRIGKRER